MIPDEVASQVTANTALLLGVIITAIFSILSAYFSYVASRQINQAQRAFKVAEFRQAWINSLRSEIATLYAESTAGNDELAWNNPAVRKSFMSILLYINPDDPDYITIHEICEQYMLSSGNQTPDGDDITLDDKLRIASQRILKREWERLKNDIRGFKV